MQELFKKYHNIGIKYEFIENSNTHLLQIAPKDFFELADFKNTKIETILDFYDKFPESSIAFVTKDSLVTVENPEFNHEPAKENNF